MGLPAALAEAGTLIVDTLFRAADGVGKGKLGIGKRTIKGATSFGSWQGVATHVAGDRFRRSTEGADLADGVVVAGGILVLADTLAAGIDDAVTALTVHLTTSSPTTEFVARIGTEDLLVTAGFGTAAWTVARGYNDTTVASHAEDAAVSVIVPAPLTVNASGALLVAPLRTPTVFKALAAVDVTSEVTIWTPASGKKFRLMGYAMALGTAGGPVTLRDDTAGSTILVIPGNTVDIVQVSPYLGDGILSSTADHVLTAEGSSGETLSGYVFGTEE